MAGWSQKPCEVRAYSVMTTTTIIIAKEEDKQPTDDKKPEICPPVITSDPSGDKERSVGEYTRNDDK